MVGDDVLSVMGARVRIVPVGARVSDGGPGSGDQGQFPNGFARLKSTMGFGDLV